MSNGFMRRAFNGIVAARSKQAQHQVNGILLSYSDSQLQSLGYSREELKRQGYSSTPFMG